MAEDRRSLIKKKIKSDFFTCKTQFRFLDIKSSLENKNKMKGGNRTGIVVIIEKSVQF